MGNVTAWFAQQYIGSAAQQDILSHDERHAYALYYLPNTERIPNPMLQNLLFPECFDQQAALCLTALTCLLA